MMKKVNVRLNHSMETMFIETLEKISWDMELSPDIWQERYQVRIAEKNGQIIWDTGIICADNCCEICYNGPELKELGEYFCSVTIWDNCGEKKETEIAFVMGRGKLRWKTSWVEPVQRPAVHDIDLDSPSYDILKSAERDYQEFNPAQLLRQSFIIRENISRAYLFITAHGLYRAYVNGNKVGECELTPETSPYRKVLMYQSYDITHMLKKGENILGVMLADGWWCGRIGLMGNNCQYGDKLGCLAELRIWDQAGKERIITGEEFHSHESAVRHADLFVGEEYHADEQLIGWNDTGFQEADWKSVKKASYGVDNLRGQTGAGVRILQKLQPVNLFRSPKGELILDVGQIIAGWLEITVEAEAGVRIELEHSEVLDADGCFMQSVMGRNKDQKDIYITRAGTQSWHPCFTYHGFRYVRITGWPGRADVKQFKACVIGTPMDKTGFFRCDHAGLNQLFENIVWSQTGNMISVPTDCPQREKAGWTGDIRIYAPTLLRIADAESFLRRWLWYCRLEQRKDGQIPFVVPFYKQYEGYAKKYGSVSSAAWSDVIIHLPWTIYEATGNSQILQENYSAMKRWVAYEQDQAETGIPDRYSRASEKIQSRQKYLWNTGFHFGDWLLPSIMNKEGARPMDTSIATREIVASAYYAYDVRTLGKIAAILGNVKDADHYYCLYDKIVKAFGEEFIQEDGTIKNEFQGAYVLCLKFGLVPEKYKETMVERLCSLIERNNGCLDTGFASVQFLMEVLADNGEKDLAYQLLYQDKCPSWLYMVDHGATTIWESWGCVSPDGIPGCYSYNHYALGCIGEFLFREIGGIVPLLPGYGRVKIRPGVESGLKDVVVSQQTGKGKLTVHWKKKENEKLSVKLWIPHGIEAEIHLPEAQTEGSAVEKTAGTNWHISENEYVFLLRGGVYELD